MPQSCRARDFDRSVLLCLNTTDAHGMTRQLVLAGYRGWTLLEISSFLEACVVASDPEQTVTGSIHRPCPLKPIAQSVETSAKLVLDVNANIRGGLAGPVPDCLILCFRAPCWV